MHHASYRVTFVVTVACLCLPQRSHADDPPSTPVLMTLTGDDSHNAQPTFLRITSASEWRSVWSRHVGSKFDVFSLSGGRLMNVDFDRCEVIAVFGGTRTETARYADGVLSCQVDGVLALRTRLVAPQFLVQDRKQSVKEQHYQPYAFFIVAKSRSPISLQVNTQPLKGHAAKWHEVARLDAPSQP